MYGKTLYTDEIEKTEISRYDRRNRTEETEQKEPYRRNRTGQKGRSV